MKINDDLSCILTEYKKSKIQSEAEVRSKLIVPLLEYLGYPSWLTGNYEFKIRVNIDDLEDEQIS